MATEKISEEDIFQNALKLESREEQEKYVKKACGNDAELFSAVEALLKHHYSSSILDAPVLESKILTGTAPTTEAPGTIIGRYKLLERIGEGGMAVVYMAQQEEPIRRKVALKIIKLGMDTKQVIARFEAERQVLAIMDHPNIAKVIDAGATETGRPYFVMELVKGAAVTEYCDNNNLTTKERLDLFTQVCSAVQHAHQKGIIHRDIKPANVMVTLRDGKPVPKVIDFGIAKATSQKLTEKTLFTRYAQLIGTPAYMSPEQAEFSELDIDTRTDIYSLGVLLYELLTGATPFDAEKLRTAGYAEIQRIIKEEEPPKPSTKLSTLGETLTDVAEHRKASPDVLRRLLSGDLDWIVMKALEKDRTRRYETVAGLIEDIGRHLNNEPVLAAAPSRLYRMRKFVGKHRVAVLAGVAVIVGLFVGVVGISVGFVHANAQRTRAEWNFDTARDAFREMWRVRSSHVSGASVSQQRQVRLRTLATAQVLLRSFLRETGDDADILHEYGRSYKHMAELHIALEDYQKAESAYREAVSVFQKLSKRYPEEDAYDRELAYGLSGLGLVLRKLGNNAEADDVDGAALSCWVPTVAEMSFGTPVNLGAAVNSEFGDGGPSLSSDGLSLYFYSDRPDGLGGYDLWVATRSNETDDWQAPKNLGQTVNSSHYDGVPSISADGLSLYFGSRRPGGAGGEDLWVTRRATLSDAWESPVNLGEVVNSSALDSTPSISVDGQTLYFESNRLDGHGGWDIWMTTVDGDSGRWKPPVKLGPAINSPMLEQTPMISRDGLKLFFSSNRDGGFGETPDLWVAVRSSASEPFDSAAPLGLPANSAGAEVCPYLSADGSTVYFSAIWKPGSVGSWDIWQMAVLPPDSGHRIEEDSTFQASSSDMHGGKEDYHE